ncbi:GNAT family N-acetyltransferase [Salinicola halophyticus]|uniref:GNAT family N-acetyltransferase n=1 Tax=Salinicola halophyticus TaxID=1808881 RepID=UPI001CB6DE45|nr:GNAT family N-acetyltransferase [Salinicola halophyticus]
MSILREARLSDLPAIEALVKAAYGHYVDRIGKIPGPMRDIDDQRYARHIEAGHVSLLFDNADGEESVDAGNGGEPVGLLVLIPQTDTLLLDNVAVAPSAQGRGFGKVLMQVAEARARQLEFDSITLYTQELMHENLAIYRRYGYVETHRAEEFGLKRVYLRKSLA